MLIATFTEVTYNSIKHQMTMDVKLDRALDLLRRLPPQNVEKNLSRIINLVPEICEDILSSVDQPLKVDYMLDSLLVIHY